MYQYQNIEDLQREYDQLGASAKAMKLTRQVVERLDEMAAFAPGKKAPDFTLPTPEGDSLSMYSIQGKVKILDFGRRGVLLVGRKIPTWWNFIKNTTGMDWKS